MPIKILVGSSEVDLQQIKEGNRTHIHPDYDVETGENDIVLIEIQGKIR
jgi:hypothetical protein